LVECSQPALPSATDSPLHLGLRWHPLLLSVLPHSGTHSRVLQHIPCNHNWVLTSLLRGSQATHGCGDLVFSSHTTFVLVGCLTFTEYGSLLFMKVRLQWQRTVCGFGHSASALHSVCAGRSILLGL
jgi:hypothetical protein